MSIPKTIANFQTTIAAPISAGDDTFTISSVASKHGTLPDGVYGITLNEGQANEEHIIGTLDAATKTLSDVIRDVSVIDGATSQGDGYDHSAGDIAKMTNHPALIQLLGLLNGDVQLSGASPLEYDEAADLDAGDFVIPDKSQVALLAADNVLTGDNTFQGETTFEDVVDFQAAVTIPEGLLPDNPMTRAQILAAITGTTPIYSGFNNATITYDDDKVATITDNDYSVTYTFTWNEDDTIDNITDGTYVWTFTYNLGGDVTDIVQTLVTP